MWNGSTDTLGLIERQGQVKGGAAKRASEFMAIFQIYNVNVKHCRSLVLKHELTVPSAVIQHFTTRKAVNLCCSRASTSKIL